MAFELLHVRPTEPRDLAGATGLQLQVYPKDEPRPAEKGICAVRGPKEELVGLLRYAPVAGHPGFLQVQDVIVHPQFDAPALMDMLLSRFLQDHNEPIVAHSQDPELISFLFRHSFRYVARGL